jgi:hypothetical protein
MSRLPGCPRTGYAVRRIAGNLLLLFALVACTPSTPAAPEGPRIFTGSGYQETTPFTLAGGDYVATWTATAERSCSHFVDLVGEGTVKTIASTGVDGAGDGLSGIYDVRGGSYHLRVNSGCKSWTVQLTPQT